MAKSVRLSDEAYDKLIALKRKDETLSELIIWLIDRYEKRKRRIRGRS